MRAKTRREPQVAAPSSRDNTTPASVDDHDIYFDTTPRTVENDDENASRPPPTNPEAVSVASSSHHILPRNSRSAAGVPPPPPRRPSSPPLRRTSSSAVPAKINIKTFWQANEEFERKYDLTPVHKEDGGTGSSSFVDPWEQGGSKRSSGR